MINKKNPTTTNEPAAVIAIPHGPDEVSSPATQSNSSHADTMNNPPHARKHAATVT
jgi:hypothetical protein